MAPVLVTIETSGERGEIKPKTPSRIFLRLAGNCDPDGHCEVVT
jgi:hypothetical protein